MTSPVSPDKPSNLENFGPHVLLSCNQDGAVLEVLVEGLGLEPGRLLFDFVAKESRNTVRQMVTGKKKDDIQPEAFEYLRLTKKGETLPTEINFRPSSLKGQEYNLCVLRDITKRVRLEKKSREMSFLPAMAGPSAGSAGRASRQRREWRPERSRGQCPDRSERPERQRRSRITPPLRV